MRKLRTTGLTLPWHLDFRENGVNIEEVLEGVVKTSAPTGDEDAPLKALIFDSYYDNYKGALSYVRVFDGKVKVGDRIRFMAKGKEFDVTEVGTIAPGLRPLAELSAGDVGYIAASIKSVGDTMAGDTITSAARPAKEPLPGYKPILPMVFCGIYPADGADLENLRDALEKLKLNDAALVFEPETSRALGFGFRCGFGFAHGGCSGASEREFDLDLVTTAPSVIYRVYKMDGECIELDNPTNLPDPATIEYIEEPVVKANIMSPKDYTGAIMELCQEKRGEFIDMEYVDSTRVNIHYTMP